MVCAKNKFGIKLSGYRNKKRRISLTRSDNVKKALKKRYPNGRFGEQAANWRGGVRKANKAGYIYIYKPDHPFATKGGNVMEHRVVLEEKIGRYLEPHEIAHHINGIKDDNRPENLALTEKGKHTQEHFHDSFETKLLKEIIKNCPRCSKKYEEAKNK